MNKYLKEFLHRGLIFGGFGPIILGIVYFILSKTLNDFSLNGTEVLLGIVSTYLLAFVQASVSVFNQIEHWSTPKSLFCHFGSLYAVYVFFYVVNSWIPFEWGVIGIFTLIFVALYFIIWFTVYFIIRSTKKKLNYAIR
ncbi:MAG: DUF3021 domain-containing protein [Acutalibacteraceae bacterium]|nr:DUF3021 domain-containing protein [Acutalibacteraceae bacterium]